MIARQDDRFEEVDIGRERQHRHRGAGDGFDAHHRLGVGGRAYLVKKTADEVRRFQPAVEALVRKGVVTPEDLGDSPSKSRTDGDEEMSVDSFADRPQIDLEKELSPVRLVEELRRIRRLSDALVAKGVITQDDLNRVAE